MARLPVDHGDNNVGAAILNDFLLVGHNADGTLKIVSAAERICYVSPRGSDSNDGLSWANAKLTINGALSAFTGDNLLIRLGASTTSNPISTGGSINLSGKSNIVIEGLGGGNHLSVPTRGQPSTVVSHSGTGSGNIFDMRETRSCILRGFRLQYTSTSFTGTVIYSGADVGYSFITTNNRFEDLYVGGSSSSVYTAAFGIKIDNSIMTVIRDCDIACCVMGVGRDDGTNIATNVSITNTRFETNTTRHITNVALNWTIDNCTFEGLQSGDARSICNDTDVTCNGMRIVGSWFGDVTGSGNQINLKMTGADISGNFIATKATGACIIVGNNSSGFSIRGNNFYASSTAVIGIELGTGCTSYDINPNAYSSWGSGLHVSPSGASRRVDDATL